MYSQCQYMGIMGSTTRDLYVIYLIYVLYIWVVRIIKVKVKN